MNPSQKLGEKGRRLLRLLVGEIWVGRFRIEQPATFMGYGEALDMLEIPRRGRAGQQLKREGLDELSAWTAVDPEIPKIDGLIIDKRRKNPGLGFAAAHGHSEEGWQEWWIAETTRAIEFKHWDRYLREQEVDEGALKLLWEKGQKAWKDVPSASEWVESLRGNKGYEK